MSESTYRYTAVDATGRHVRGAITASGEQEAFRRLTSDGLTPVTMTATTERGPAFSWQKVGQADLAGLTRELAVLVEARIPLERGLRSIAEQEPKPQLAAMVRGIAASIEAGNPITDALHPHREFFGEVYIESMRAAEKSGNLRQVLLHLADLLDRQIESRQQLRRAMMYPVIVVGAVFIAVTVIVVFVVPKFAATFASHGVKMPFMTRALQAVGVSVTTNWYVYLLAAVAIVGGAAAYLRTPSGRMFFERLMSRTPYVRRIIQSATLGQFSRVLGIGLSSGLDVIESIEIGGRATGRRIFTSECAAIAERLRRGEELPEILRSGTSMPSFARRLLGAGKDAAELSRAATVLSNHYERECSHLTKSINTIIEPLMTFALAAIVLVVALSVFLPMWQMVRLNH